MVKNEKTTAHSNGFMHLASMAETPNGLFVYYYGYKGNGDGEAQWLLSKAMPGVIEKGKTYGVDMVSGFVGNGGSFTAKPIIPNSGRLLTAVMREPPP